MEELAQKATPIDASEFEREQLRFFLGNSDMVGVLTEINPSLAWLPILAEMNLPQNDAALPAWVERNFSSLDAVREVVDNIRCFKAESARILEIRLNAQRDTLEPLLVKCWRLIIRHIHNAAHGTIQNEWFEIAPRLNRSDFSAEVFDRVSRVLTPKLFVEKRYAWYDEQGHKIEMPSDVLSIKYRVGDGVSESDFFRVWPNAVSADIYERFVRTLTNSLSHVLADAIEVGVESEVGFGMSDVEVPSVAAHEQNAFHEGFLLIVRVIAELWSRLIAKSARAGRDILQDWEGSNFRLMRRLALYAAADPIIASKKAAEVLIRLPPGELFLTNSQVEVHRLIRARWGEFPAKQRELIEKRIIDGPPVDWFREGTDLNRPRDRCRFRLLLDLERSGVPLGKKSVDLAARNKAEASDMARC